MSMIPLLSACPEVTLRKVKLVLRFLTTSPRDSRNVLKPVGVSFAALESVLKTLIPEYRLSGGQTFKLVQELDYTPSMLGLSKARYAFLCQELAPLLRALEKEEG